MDAKSYYNSARMAREEWLKGNRAFARVLHRLISENIELRELVRRDPFTRLFNKAAFLEELADNVAHASSSGYPLGLVIVDIDNFKRINDTYGHPVGDGVIAHVAGSIRDNSRSSDVVARIGGEEFAVIAPMTDEKGVAHFGENLVAKVSAASLPDALKDIGTITVSAGAVALRAGDDPAGMYRRADAALYVAKNSGKKICYVLKSREVA